MSSIVKPIRFGELRCTSPMVCNISSCVISALVTGLGVLGSGDDGEVFGHVTLGEASRTLGGLEGRFEEGETSCECCVLCTANVRA